MNRSYALDTTAAKQAGASNYINETGPYVGRMVRAEEVKSKQDTEGIEFTFKSDDDRTCDFLTCWTYNAKGDGLYGLKMLNAIMTCMKVKDIAPRAMTIKDRDGASKQISGFTDLIDKPIGLLLQREEYEKQDQSIGYKFNIVGCYEARSGMTAGEILDRAPKAEQLTKWVAQLKDKPMQARRAAASHATPAKTGGAFDDMDDSIPF